MVHGQCKLVRYMYRTLNKTPQTDGHINADRGHHLGGTLVENTSYNPD